MTRITWPPGQWCERIYEKSLGNPLTMTLTCCTGTNQGVYKTRQGDLLVDGTRGARGILC